MIKAVIFDFDGLILDTETLWYECYKEVLAQYQVELPLEVFAQIIGTHDSLFHEYMKEQLKDTASIDVINKTAAALHKEKVAEITIREGVKEFLDEAKELGLRIGLATSSSTRWVIPFLKKFEIIDYFESIKTRDDVENIKPDPELYLKTLDEFQIQPEEAIVFEDSLNGATAAKRAGIPCVIVPNPVTKDLDFKDFSLIIESMGTHSLNKIIKQMIVS
ncbi:HAD family hydrolase [Bacillus niameyensis]|uniref:HAD family hydrolase n=1 Tax=Bacillus niameyensis TaxID=1522308 RepID=UPI000A53FDEA|nr:HAD family hydrolase [Bacillus niameyensis]